MTWQPPFVSRAQERLDRKLAERDQAARAERATRAARAVAEREAAAAAEPLPLLRITHAPHLRVVTATELRDELAGHPRPWSLEEIAAAEHRIQVRHLRSLGLT
jgi:hypothetical protein